MLVKFRARLYRFALIADKARAWESKMVCFLENVGLPAGRGL
jgi:hypothetical protein